MSKIFDMLNRGEGDIAEIIRPLVEPHSVSQPPAPREIENGAASPPKASEQPARESTPAAPPDKAPFLAAVRTLSLRLPAPSPLLPFEEGQWLASEQYRILRTKIGQHPKQPHLILVSSPAPGDGKASAPSIRPQRCR